MEIASGQEHPLARNKKSKALFYACFSFLCLLTGPFIFLPIIALSPVSSIVGIFEANRFEKAGASDTLGKVLSWISLALSVVLISLGVLFLGFILEMAHTIYDASQ